MSETSNAMVDSDWCIAVETRFDWLIDFIGNDYPEFIGYLLKILNLEY